MKQSSLFTRTLKALPKDETSLNAQLLIRAGFVQKAGAGIYSFLPLGLRVHNKICGIIRKEMASIGAQEILMPALTPKRFWQKTGRWKNFDALYKLQSKNGKEYALGATHEEIVTPLVKKFISSYQDLSVAVFQIQTKFRDEPRAKAGLLRGREFSMKDLYSFHPSEEALNTYYKIVQQAYFKIFEQCGLLDITYLTYATGGAFSKYSHEFQTVCKNGEDLIHICDNCKIAVNQELIKDHPGCPGCGTKLLRQLKAVEVGNIFKLGTRFSEPIGLNYRDEQGKERPVIMGCYGLGPSRLLATMVETLHDERGMVWPKNVAPFAAHLLSLQQNAKADAIYQDLIKAGLETLYDDREGISAGVKLADADLIGCAYRLIISEKSLASGGVEVKKRDEQTSTVIKPNKLINYLQDLA